MKTLTLRKIFIFSLFTGLSFGFSYIIGGSRIESGIGFTFLNIFSGYVDPSIQSFLMIVSTLFAIIFIFKLASFFRKVYEQRYEGIITAIIGFSGSIFFISGILNNSQLVVPGIGLLIIGILIVILRRKENQIKQF